jgi:benzoyl-CoA reductase/2-hydroxyglutaryl-CoA dehydratase subunit BcrC/BadD/HgdB
MNGNDFLQKFGEFVGHLAKKDPAKAQKILTLAFQAKDLQLKWAPGKDLLPSKQYVAREMMASMLGCLRHPERTAMVSLFVPCEPLHSMGLLPYSVEGFSCYLTGAFSQEPCLMQAAQEGLPETLCSYHRIFLGASGLGIMPKPNLILSTNLACDANQLTFPRMAQTYQVPHFKLDVPYLQNEEAVADVAQQLRDMTAFLAEVTGQPFSEERLKESVSRSRQSVENYRRFLAGLGQRYVAGDVTSEMYACFAYHPLLGTQETLRFSQLCLEDLRTTPKSRGVRLLWLHTIPFWQDCVRQMLNFQEEVSIVTCDMTYEGLIEQDEDKTYESMAQRLVYSAFNGPASYRIQKALQMAEQVQADGAVFFCHWGCKQTLGAARLVKDSLEQAGLPTLILDGDGCDPKNSSDGQVQTRLGAFVEMLKKGKS